MGAVILWCRAWLDRLNPQRRSRALAERKRHLEHLLHDAGLSRTQARRITSEFFHHD